MEDRIISNLNLLSKHLTNIDPVLIQIFEKGIISEDEKETVQLPHKTTLVKNSDLWMMLNKKGWDRIESCVVDILRCTSNEHCADIITGVTSQNETYTKGKPKILKRKWWPDKKQLVNSFCHRKSDGCLLVEKLHDILTASEENQGPVISRKVTICGLGGIGKTSTAKWYAQHFEDNYDQIIWIDCEGNSLLEAFKNLAPILDVKEYKNIALKYLTVECYEKLSGVKCLFIFDNAECYLGERGIKSALPPENSNFYTIITSRHTEWGHPNGLGYITNFPLDVFSAVESFDFLSNNLSDKVYNDSQIKKLATCLGHLPLALQIAVSMLNKIKMDLGSYIKNVENSVGLLDKSFDDYEKSIHTTMWISLEQIKTDRNGGELADQILSSFAYLSSDYIPEKFFMAILGAKEEVELSLHLLQSYSLITANKIGVLQGDECLALNIHRLLQQVIRRLKRNEAGNTLTKILQTKGFLSYKATPFLHTMKLRNIELEELKLGIEYFDGYRLHLVEKKRLKDLLEENRYSDAIALSQLFFNSYDAGDSEYIRSKYNYAFCLKQNGNFEESLPIFENIYEEKFIWSRSHSSDNNLKILELLHSIPSHYKYLIGIECMQMYITRQCFTMAQKYFVDTAYYFLQSWPDLCLSPYEMNTRRKCLILFGCSIAAGNFSKKDFLQTKNMISLTATLVESPFTNFTLWDQFYKLIGHMIGYNKDMDEYMYTQLYQTQKHICYGNSYSTEFNNFGKHIFLWRWNICNSSKISTTVGKMRKLAFGTKDDIYKRVGRDEELRESSDDRKEVNLFGRNPTPNLDCFTELLNLSSFSSNLKKLVLVRLRVFRADLIYSLVSCVNLDTIILLEVNLVGGCCERLYLPKLRHFRGHFVQTYDAPLRNLLFYKFFVKVSSVGMEAPVDEWMDVLTMDLFHITDEYGTVFFRRKIPKTFICRLSDRLNSSLFKDSENVYLLNCHVQIFENAFSCLSFLKLGKICFIDNNGENIPKILICDYFGSNLKILILVGEQYVVELKCLKSVKTLHLELCDVVVHKEQQPNIFLRDISVKYTKFFLENDFLRMVNTNLVFGGFTSVNNLLLHGRNMSIDLNKLKISSIDLNGVTILNCDEFEIFHFVHNKLYLQGTRFRNCDGSETENIQFLYGFKTKDMKLQFHSYNPRLKFSIDLKKISSITERLSIFRAHLIDNDFHTEINLPNLEFLSLDLCSSAEIPDLLACRKLKMLILSLSHSACSKGRSSPCRKFNIKLNLNEVPPSVMEMVLENVVINKVGDFPFELDKLQFGGHLFETEHFTGQIFKTNHLVVATSNIDYFFSKNSNRDYNIFNLISPATKECSTIVVGQFWWDSNKLSDYGASSDDIKELHPYYVFEKQTGKWRGISHQGFNRYTIPK